MTLALLDRLTHIEFQSPKRTLVAAMTVTRSSLAPTIPPVPGDVVAHLIRNFLYRHAM